MSFTLSTMQTDTYGFFETFPSHVSGAVHVNLIWRKLKFIENFMGETIGSASIDDKYYQPLYDYTISSILGVLQSNDGTAASNVSLGDFSFGNKTGGSNDVKNAQTFFEKQALEGLNNIKFLGYDTRMYKAT